jgi:hypothetical protein
MVIDRLPEGLVLYPRLGAQGQLVKPAGADLHLQMEQRRRQVLLRTGNVQARKEVIHRDSMQALTKKTPRVLRQSGFCLTNSARGS